MTIPGPHRFHLAHLAAPGYDRIRRSTAELIVHWGHDPGSASHLDLRAGTLVLHGRGGTDLVFPAQSLGVYTRHDSCFTWSWDEPLPPGASEIAHRLRSYGRRTKDPYLLTSAIHCRQDRAWDLTALAVHLSRAWSGHEVSENPDRFRYLVIGRPQLVAPAFVPTTPQFHAFGQPDTPSSLPDRQPGPTTLAA